MVEQRQWAVRLRKSGYGRVYITIIASTRQAAKEKAAILFQVVADDMVALLYEQLRKR